jgi:16S rRNA (guanine527-N7)-methyltransferase
MIPEHVARWFAERDVSRETIEKIESFCAAVVDETGRQNLISARTIPNIWDRHVLDSAQLIDFTSDDSATWLDLGTGAGFPGMIIALLRNGPVELVESRTKRAAFLDRQAACLGLDNVTVHAAPLQKLAVHQPAGVISARAFAPLADLLTLAHRFSHDETLWLLPKGRSAAEELESVRRTWHGQFRIERSISDDDARIIVATNVSPRTFDR